MKISTKGRYAMRMMIEFALHPNECTKISQVAKRQQISDKYLEQIVSVLTHAGYVKSMRGAQGGYQLTKSPAEYTVGMILRLTEGSLAPVACLEETADPCPRMEICPTIDIWRELDAAISRIVDHITLEDLIQKQQDKATE
jgi:Rrf2 family protein